MLEAENLNLIVQIKEAVNVANIVVNPESESAIAVCAWIDKKLIEIQEQNVA